MGKCVPEKYYLPSFLMNIFLQTVLPYTYGLFILIISIDYISRPGGRPASHLTIPIFSFTIIFVFIWLLVSVIARYFFFSLVLQNDILNLRKGDTTLKEIGLDSFTDFIIDTTSSLEASGGLIKIELFVTDHNNSKQKVFQNDIGNSLVRSWKKFMIKLKNATKKDFQFCHYVVDIDGKKYKMEEYEKVRWKKRVSLFKSPYK
jgi:hypothetical protein